METSNVVNCRMLCYAQLCTSAQYCWTCNVLENIDTSLVTVNIHYTTAPACKIPCHSAYCHIACGLTTLQADTRFASAVFLLCDKKHLIKFAIALDNQPCSLSCIFIQPYDVGWSSHSSGPCFVHCSYVTFDIYDLDVSSKNLPKSTIWNNHRYPIRFNHDIVDSNWKRCPSVRHRDNVHRSL